ncbi:MAG: hypothetical protein MUP85_08100 [Candidatus Lokiarchaeota archaeon]|nr:hypothetical protein [Candidatus Lokiarchaeota archaeon]
MLKIIKYIKHLFSRTKKQKAVFDEDLTDLLKSLGILDAVNTGYYKCEECDCTISIENIGSLIKKENEIKFTCNKFDCMGS